MFRERPASRDVAAAISGDGVMSFLHEDKIVPADELTAEKPPDCPRCGAQMWLIVFTKTTSDEGTDGSYTYECKQCGASTTIEKAGITV